MCHGVDAALDLLRRLEQGNNEFESWADLVAMAKAVQGGAHSVKVTEACRETICEYLTQPDCDLLANLQKKRLERFVRKEPALPGDLRDAEVTEALEEIIVAGKGVDSTKDVLDMMVHSLLKNLPLWDLSHEVHLAAAFLPHPATEEDDVIRVVEFLQDSYIMAEGFELEYGDLVHLLLKTLGIKGCLNRLRLFERSGLKCTSFEELEAGMEPVRLPTKATRDKLAGHLKDMHLECPEDELDELLLVGGSITEIVEHLKTLQALNKVPERGNQLAEALDAMLNSERHKKESVEPEEADANNTYVKSRIKKGQTFKLRTHVDEEEAIN
jgi:hypothetical protein